MAKGIGQMALFLSASARQGYKPLLFAMVATNLLCSSIEQHPTVVGTLLLIMGSVNRDNPALDSGCIGSGGRLEEDQSVGPNSARGSRSNHKTVELSFPQAHGLSSEARDQHLCQL